MDWTALTVLLTGGTGSFGRKFAEIALAETDLKKLIVFSRDELKQHEMRSAFGPKEARLRFFIGDVRDEDRLHRALQGVDLIVHAAALKQVPSCEYNPFEAVKTNILGASNIIDVAIDAGVKKVLALSTDKAVSPINLYGATKLVAEKLFVQGNAYAGAGGTRFSCVRYGNVVGSRGSVIPFWRSQQHCPSIPSAARDCRSIPSAAREEAVHGNSGQESPASGKITITDERMTRFWITLEQGVRFVFKCVDLMQGGEVFVPKIPSMRILDLAEVVAPGCEREVVGIRPGEKLHEVLVSRDESRYTLEFDDMYLIQPVHPWWQTREYPGARAMEDGAKYSSDGNTRWLSREELRGMIDDNP
jgi:UDP-N-acetylglucosamine 4,6-dehydratase